MIPIPTREAVVTAAAALVAGVLVGAGLAGPVSAVAATGRPGGPVPPPVVELRTEDATALDTAVAALDRLHPGDLTLACGQTGSPGRSAVWGCTGDGGWVGVLATPLRYRVVVDAPGWVAPGPADPASLPAVARVVAARDAVAAVTGQAVVAGCEADRLRHAEGRDRRWRRWLTCAGHGLDLVASLGRADKAVTTP